MKYRKDLNVSRIRTGELTDDMSLTDKVGLISDILQELIRALEKDLGAIDIDNFSEHGIAQIEKLIEERVSS